MRPSVEVHDALARLVEYPRESYAHSIQEAANRVAIECPAAWKELEPFIAFTRSTSLGELEEQFAVTFDNTDERALEVGWHVYGENYTRGSFMATMRRELREHGVEENGELPDHLSHLLPLLARAPEERAKSLVLETVAPAVRKVHLALQKQDSPWAGVLGAVIEVLAQHDAQARTVAPAVAPVHEPSACEPGWEVKDE